MSNQSKRDWNIVEQMLLHAGWYEGRKIHVMGWKDILRSNGIDMFLAAEFILEQFGGLLIRPEYNSSARFMIMKIEFDPVKAGVGEFDRITPYISVVGSNLCPIGEIDGVNMILVCEKGRVYAHLMDEMYLFGDDIHEALHMMIVRDRDPVIIS